MIFNRKNDRFQKFGKMVSDEDDEDIWDSDESDDEDIWDSDESDDSDEDDEDIWNEEEEVEWDYEFSVTLGGPLSEECPFLSVEDQDVYDKSCDEDDVENVEIVFTGKDFISASECKNRRVQNNGQGALIEATIPGKRYLFRTTTGYIGLIIVDEGEMKSNKSVIEVSVYCNDVEED